MPLFGHKEFDQHEQVSFFNCPETGLRAIIAVHNTVLGPALGGCRMWAYENDDQALNDVLRLSRGMTYKSAISNLPLGGGDTTSTQPVTPAGTCFQLIAFKGAAFGTSDVLCGVPGVSTLAQGSSRVASVEDAAEAMQALAGRVAATAVLKRN